MWQTYSYYQECDHGVISPSSETTVKNVKFPAQKNYLTLKRLRLTCITFYESVPSAQTTHSLSIILTVKYTQMSLGTHRYWLKP